MLAACPPGVSSAHLGADRVRVTGEYELGGPLGAPEGWLPDLTDPATVGGLQRVVRDAQADPHLRARYSISQGTWEVYCAGADRRTDRLGVGPTEAAALVAALWADALWGAS